MMPVIFLLFFLCERTVPETLEVVATPDFPVAAGQTVALHCSVNTSLHSITWFLQRLENHAWKEVSKGRDLILTRPQESGLYRCYTENQTSLNHSVYIVATLSTVGENLGITAFAFSLLALSINFIILFWLWWQRFSVTLDTSTTATPGFPGPDKAPKGGFPQAEDDRSVYMNYTGRNQDYVDLDPAGVTVDNVYSALS